VTEVQNVDVANPVPPYKFRLARLPYFFWVLSAPVACFVLAMGISLIIASLTRFSAYEAGNLVGGRLFVLTSVATHFVLVVGRCHDIGWSGWRSLLLLVPIVGLVVWVYLFFAKSI
jgi:uncharacterized membrane protein YhaH (DUF805 family)